LLGGLVITVLVLYAAPRRRTGQGRGPKGPGPKGPGPKGRGPEGGGLYPELAVWGFQEGVSPNVLSAVGRQVAQLPITLAQAELQQRGLDLDRKAVQRLGAQLGEQMLAVRTRDLLRWRAGQLLPGHEFVGKRLAVQIDGGRTRIRTVIEKSKVGKRHQRRKIRVEWREPKLLILYELDAQGRMKRGSRPVIDGTLRGPDALMELVAFHLYRLGAGKAQQVVFAADGAPWIWARLDWVSERAGLERKRVRLVLDWYHAAHHLSLAIKALGQRVSDPVATYRLLRQQLLRGQVHKVLDQLEDWADDEGPDALWRELIYLVKHADAGRLDYARSRRQRLPIGSGAIESAVRRVINQRLKGNSVYWKADHAEAVLQLRAVLLSGRWDETLAHVQESMAKDRRRTWHWEPVTELAELKALDTADAADAQLPGSKRSTPRAA
jgi:hypothetical protein